MLNDQTKLLDVLAEEFDNHGITVDRDINGLKEINGLNLRGKSGRRGERQNTGPDDDFRGTLSSLKTIEVQPGVVLREFLDKK